MVCQHPKAETAEGAGGLELESMCVHAFVLYKQLNGNSVLDQLTKYSASFCPIIRVTEAKQEIPSGN